ncbi:MAG: anaerobic ribonucleoside-triphosphate reductase activating protein [Candidatus Pacebacteria bacterium]|nr:anaerobic ribonucleoside-triphosphate reductase activating protein [Candidatus Paceibacterota bacterium]MCF7857553.1 anaerobic ribonucleoside-triphosphate reductase activating protein [Candidatus Paceibacterota bacterium]
MRIGGLQKNSLIDYPGKISAIVFTIGCNFHCPYCHNPELVDETADEISAEGVLAFLKKRVGLLEAVTITGGEPTVQTDLIPFIKKIKEMGFLVKLDTNGTNPEIVEQLLHAALVDYIAMDIKSPLDSYSAAVGRPVPIEKVKKSIALMMRNSVPYEFRTTVVKSLLSPDDIIRIGEVIKGAKTYYLQKFVPTKTLNPAFLKKTTYTDSEFEDMKNSLSAYVDKCYVR